MRDLGFVVPGVDSEIRLQTSDDEAVESLRFLVDGQEVERVTPINASGVEHSFFWAPPASAEAGSSFVLRVESRDFADNVASYEATVTVPTGPILRGGGSLFDDYQGQEVTLADGEFVAREPLHVGTLRIARGASLGTLGPPDDEGTLEVVADVLDLACGFVARSVRSRLRWRHRALLGDGLAKPGRGKPRRLRPSRSTRRDLRQCLRTEHRRGRRGGLRRRSRGRCGAPGRRGARGGWEHSGPRDR